MCEQTTYQTMISSGFITVAYSSGKVQQIARDHSNAPAILDAIRNRMPAIELAELFDRSLAVRQKFGDDIEIVDGELFFEEEAIHNTVCEKINQFIELDLPVDGLLNFLRRLQRNPSKNSLEQLYAFLEREDLPILPDGRFIAYKGVQKDGSSVHTDRSIKLISGRLAENGAIVYVQGNIVKVPRNYVEDDPNVGCGRGIHCGAYSYARSFAPRLIKVAVDPAHVVSVPHDCSFQKIRVEELEVLDDCVEQIRQEDLLAPGQKRQTPTPLSERGPFMIKVDVDGDGINIVDYTFDTVGETVNKLDELGDLNMDAEVYDTDGVAVTSSFEDMTK